MTFGNKMKKLYVIIGCCLGVAFLGFPWLRPQGITLKREGTLQRERDGSLLIRLSAFVYRGVWFSPDGPTTARWYYETIKITGQGAEVHSGARNGQSYSAGTDFLCIGSRFYDSGSLFLDNSGSFARVYLVKKWTSERESLAYVNGAYQLTEDKKPNKGLQSTAH